MWIEFDHPRPVSRQTVVEEQDVAILEKRGVMGSRNFPLAPGPDDLAVGEIEDGDRILVPNGDQNSPRSVERICLRLRRLSKELQRVGMQQIDLVVPSRDTIRQ